MLLSYSSVFVWAFALAVLSIAEAGRGKLRTAEVTRKIGSTCREPAVFQNFDMTRIEGLWYVYLYSHHGRDLQYGCDCFTSQFVRTDENTFRISNCCQVTKVSNETQVCNIGIDNARIADAANNEALFMFTRNGAESRFWIIDTDYDNYMIVDACETVSDNEERELFWIVSRDKEINEMTAKKVDQVLLAKNLENNKNFRQRHGADICKSKRP